MLEHNNTAKFSDFHLHAVAEHSCHNFIIAGGEDTWIRRLKHADTFYVVVLAKTLLNHLEKYYGGLHALDVINLKIGMRSYYGKAVGISEYINMLEDTQKRAKIPISDDFLLVIASNSCMEANTFPNRTKTWGKCKLDNKKWVDWKFHYS